MLDDINRDSAGTDLRVIRKPDFNHARQCFIIILDIAERDEYFCQSGYRNSYAGCQRFTECIADSDHDLYRDRDWPGGNKYLHENNNCDCAYADLHADCESDLDYPRQFFVTFLDDAEHNEYFH